MFILLLYDVLTVAERGLSRADDSKLLKIAEKEKRIFITRDRDFGGLVFAARLGSGVIYLRMLPSTQKAVHKELEKVLAAYLEDELKQAFVVVEPGRHRFRKISYGKK